MGDSLITTRPPDVRLRTTDVQPPTALYITPNDRLYVQTANSLSGIAIEISLRILLPDGQIIPQREFVRPAATRSTEAVIFTLPEGFLLSVMATSFGAGLLRGQTFIQVQLVRGVTNDLTSAHMLIAEYVTSSESIAWPGGTQRDSLSGRGNIRSISGTNPAAGVEILETVPTNALWRLQSVYFQLTTDGTVSNRTVRFALDDGTSTLASIEASAVQAASLTRGYNVAPGLPLAAPTVNNFLIPAPIPLLLREGYRFGTSTSNLQAGDDYTAPQYVVEEWLQT